jgi:hypothetical protein
VRIAAELDKIVLPKAPTAGMPQRLPAPAGATAAPKPVGWITVAGEGIAIHEQLLAALPDTAQPFVRSLRPEGTVDFQWRCDRTDPFAPRADTALDLKLVNCTVQYDRFPYPLERVHGLVTARNGQWTLSGVESRDRQGTAVVVTSCSTTT